MSYLEDQGFKAGDTIVCVSTGAPNIYKVGDEFTIEVCLGGYLNIPVRGNLLGGSFGKWKLKVEAQRGLHKRPVVPLHRNTARSIHIWVHDG